MLARITGNIIDIEDNIVILENNNIAYEISIPESHAIRLSAGIGQTIAIHTHMNIREDGITLYGFLTEDDRKLFRRLITISGIGPKLGLALLSTFSADELQNLIAIGDAESISRCKGLGKKTAEKLVLELKKEMKERCVFGVTTALASNQTVYDDVFVALTSLGFSSGEIKKALDEIPLANLTTAEDIISAALKKLR